MATELATAYIALVPSMKGAQGEIAKAIIPDAQAAGDRAGKETGGRFSGAFKTALGAAAIGAAVVAGFTGLYKVGSIFDDVSDTIRVGTGATGEALRGLEEDAKRVATSVPTSFEAAGSTVADLNTRLGLSGETLQTVASQYLEAGRILGEDVDINTTSAAFSAFKIEGDAVSGAMDDLFRVSQATGVGMNELAGSVQANAPAVQALGFSFLETASLAGSLDKAGLNTNQVMGSLSRSLVNLAKDGEEPQAAFQRVVGELEGFIEAGDTASAIDLAGKVFGTRGASQLVGAIESGTLALDDLVGAAGMTEDTILGLGSETADFAESWQLVKNNGLAAIEPLSTAVFGLAGGAMAKVADLAQTLGPAISGGLTAALAGVGPLLSSLGTSLGPLIGQALEVWSAFSPLSLIFQVLQPLLPQLAGVVTQLASALGGTLTSVLSSLMTALTPVITVLTGTLTEVIASLLPIVGEIAMALGATLGTVLVALTPLLVMLAELIGSVLQAVLPLITPVLGLVQAFLPLLTPIIELVGALLAPLIQLLTALLTPILGLITPLISGLGGALGFIIDVLATVIGWIVQGITWFVALVTGSKTASAQLSAVWGAIGSFFSGIWSGIVGAFSAGVSKVTGFVGGLRDTVLGILQGAGTWLLDSGKAIIQGLIDGIKGMIGAVGDAVGGVMDFVGGFFPNSPAERGPFSGAGWTRLLHSGEAIGEQFADGLHGSSDLVAAELEAMLTASPSSDFAPTVGIARAGGGIDMSELTAGADAASEARATYILNGITTRRAAEEIAEAVETKKRRRINRTGALTTAEVS